MSAFRKKTRGFSGSDSGPNGTISEIERPGNFNPDLGPSHAAGRTASPAAKSSGTGSAGNGAAQHDASLQSKIPQIQVPNQSAPHDAAAQKSQPAPRPSEANGYAAYVQSGGGKTSPNAAASATRPVQTGQARKAEPAPAKSKKRRSSDKELQKLRRVDLLELLVDQIRENDRLVADNDQLTEENERLRTKLDERDAQVEYMRKNLIKMDEQVKRVESRNRALAHAAGTLDVGELIAIEERAIDQHLKQLLAQGDISSVNSGAQVSRRTYSR